MNKQGGFTLIELLAVIVILAIIAVIAVPIVLNIIDETKDNAGLRSAEMYIKAAELSIAQSTLKDINIPDGEYSLKDGDICIGTLSNNECNGKLLEVEVNGKVPESGTIKITNGNISDLSIMLNEKTIIKNSDGDLVYQEAPTLASCELKSGTAKTIGAKYECDFGDGKRNFYILDIGTNPTNQNLKEDEVALILEGNYDTTTQTWCASGSDNSCNTDGVTSKLDDIAEAWSELEREQIVLPSAEQIVVADGQSKDAYYTDYVSLSNAWLYNWDNSVWGDSVYAYWTSSTVASNSNYAWFVYFSGAVDFSGADGFVGVRPVVNLKN